MFLHDVKAFNAKAIKQHLIPSSFEMTHPVMYKDADNVSATLRKTFEFLCECD